MAVTPRLCFEFKQSLPEIMVKRKCIVQRIRPTDTVCSCNKKKSEHLTCFSPYTTVRVAFLTGFKSSIVHFLLERNLSCVLLWHIYGKEMKMGYDDIYFLFYIFFFLVGYRVVDDITTYIFAWIICHTRQRTVYDL